ncbi:MULTISPECIES: hypothetical protein [Limnochorda]|uniref:hypothetical protein n=1 Tax=Limnochorda TaxID=1676651 RepID=UPI001E1520B2|nr:hypothetical protein [Limnochorda pilosa]MBO2487194.1 hypothetical protein [Bacillota bacterium]MBO2519406.1 hypothetical protein [Bacillota bacterium]
MADAGDLANQDRIDPAELERAIARIRGVLSSRVVLDPSEAHVDELHVLAHTGRNAKQVVRDIVSLLQAQFGLEVDHRVISVAQVEVQGDEPALPAYEPRLVLDSILVENRQKSLRVRVQLQRGEALYEGEAEGNSHGVSPTRLGAEAGLRAVQEFMEGLCQVTLEDVLNVEMGDGHVVVTGVQLSVRGRAPEFLVGSAMVHSDPVEAAVRSVLDALNRKLVLFRMEEEMV